MGIRKTNASEPLMTCRKRNAAMLAAVPAGANPAGGECPDATVVISGNAKDDRRVGSPDVNVSGARETRSDPPRQNVRSVRPPTGTARGGTRAPVTCTPPSRSPGSILWGWCRCSIPCSASSALHEPPYAAPHVRWCGRAAGVIPPLPDSALRKRRFARGQRMLYSEDSPKLPDNTT